MNNKKYLTEDLNQKIMSGSDHHGQDYHERREMLSKQSYISNVCHVYSQEFWHDPVIVVGDKESLLAIKNAIEEALAHGRGLCQLYVNDGEEYNFIAYRVDDTKTKQSLASPYTAWEINH